MLVEILIHEREDAHVNLSLRVDGVKGGPMRLPNVSYHGLCDVLGVGCCELFEDLEIVEGG